ncbi:PQQ-binding-like beta-propeller repeat protein [Streptomyces sp. NPDC005385]|uniref:outer membrane protein assembly factor BamB family protein n=1 Tax=Streptomyces sp. NPDC005385 TaxID=3157039 RepID=UPI0033B4E06D
MTVQPGLQQTAAFRHDPVKSVLPGPAAQVLWDREPAVCGYRRLSHRTRAGATVPVPVCSTPVVIGNEGVVVGSYDGRIRRYTPDLADVSWEHRVASPLYASLVVDPMRSTVVSAAVDGTVTCLGIDGGVIWKADVGMPVYATPTLLHDAGLVVLTAFGSQCAGLDLSTGQQVFAVGLPSPWPAALGGSAAFRDPYAGPLALPGGDFVVGCAEHALRVTAAGQQVWQRNFGHSVRASPAFAAPTGEVIVCTVDGRCRFLDAESGHETAVIDCAGKITASPAVSGRIVALGTRHGPALGIDVLRHEIVWSAPGAAPRDHTSFTVLPNGAFAATTASGNVAARTSTEGRFLWETSQLLGLANHDPALDTTPVAAPDGSMYCGSYSGVIYRFRFRPAPGEPS